MPRPHVLGPPLMLVAVSIVFTMPGRPIGEWVVGPLSVTATDAGFLRFTSILARSWLSVQMAILLVATTPFAVLLHALEHLHLPRPLIGTISLAYRYLSVLADEASRLLRARAARSAGRGPRGSRAALWHAAVAGHMVGQLLLRSFERSERIYGAMLARGYRGEPMALHPPTVSPGTWAVAGATVVYIALLQTIARLDVRGLVS
ncbi:MAG: hypothetical protein GEU73_16555 [Chloroflexi bacterium]|nr:hypothetical protein [Chloroflexota bacterium]